MTGTLETRVQEKETATVTASYQEAVFDYTRAKSGTWLGIAAGTGVGLVAAYVAYDAMRGHDVPFLVRSMLTAASGALGFFTPLTAYALTQNESLREG
jgi:hypothetical protein